MLELGAGADILRAASLFYLMLIGLLVALALWLPKRGWQKALIVVSVLAVSAGPALKRSQEQTQQIDERKGRYERAKALFDERCKTAGTKIYKTADNVDAVLLLNVPRSASNADLKDSNWPEAGLPQQFGGDGYISSFLAWKRPATGNAPPMTSAQTVAAPGGGYYRYPGDLSRDMALTMRHESDAIPGYHAVDVKDEAGVLWRYTSVREGAPVYKDVYNYKAVKKQYVGPPARYAVAYTNLIDLEDRKQWVAGTTVKVSDTQTGELLAEGTWYSFEPGLGDLTDFRSPWLFAKTCPEMFPGQERAVARYFVDRVLKIKQEM